MNGEASSKQFEDRGLGKSWLTAVLLILPLAFMGEFLIASTRHRPLGAVTYASLVVLAWAVVDLLSRRGLNADASTGRLHTRRVLWVVALVSVVVVVSRAVI